MAYEALCVLSEFNSCRKKLDCRIENVSSIVIACCILHNICQINKDDYIDDDGVLDAVIRQERNARRSRRGHNRVQAHAIDIRQALKLYIMNH